MYVLAVVLLGVLTMLLLGAHLQLRSRHGKLASELSQTQTELDTQRLSLAHLKEQVRLKNEIISIVSHELRTPLTSIRGALGLLSSGVLGKQDDRAANLLRIASSNTDRLVRMVNDILDLERMESGEAPLATRPSPVGDLLRQALETMESMASSAGVQLVLEVNSATAQLPLDTDPDRMEQVLCNLLSNAVKFSPPGSAVQLGAILDGETLTIRVEDRGRGVPANKLEAIFARFGQVEPADARAKQGTGLGLAICRSIIAQHGGTIHAERNDALVPDLPGTTLVIRLPVAKPNPVLSPKAQGLVA